MIPRWLEHAAAFLILWFALACILAPFIGARLAAMTPDPDLYGPPDRGNEDDEQDDDWDVLFEWAPPREDTDADS